MIRAVPRALLLALACLNAAGVQAGGLAVIDPWILEAPPGAGANAGYLGIRNDGSGDETLVSVQCPGFARIEIHRTTVEDGVAGMSREDSLVVPAGALLEFRPGGLHLMLMEARRRPRAGDSFPLELLFASGARLAIDFPVRRFEAGNHEHHDHGSH